MSRLVRTLGVVRSVVIVVTALALATALVQMGASPPLAGIIGGGVALACAVAPFGARNRRW